MILYLVFDKNFFIANKIIFDSIFFITKIKSIKLRFSSSKSKYLFLSIPKT